jgi:hypothetical protein
MKTIQKVTRGGITYSYERQRINTPALMSFEKIETVAKIWATVIPNWGAPGKRVRDAISVEKCFLAKSCPSELTEEQFQIFTSCPIDHRRFFEYRMKAKSNSNFVRTREKTTKAIDAYIQKYQHLLPAEAEPETPSEQSAPENISN